MKKCSISSNSPNRDQLSILAFRESANPLKPQSIGRCVLFSLLGLFCFDDTEQPACDETADKSRLIHHDQHIERIAIAAARLWNEPEIIGKNRAGGQDTTEGKKLQFFVPGILVSAALRRVDDDIQLAGFSGRTDEAWSMDSCRRINGCARRPMKPPTIRVQRNKQKRFQTASHDRRRKPCIAKRVGVSSALASH